MCKNQLEAIAIAGKINSIQHKGREGGHFWTGQEWRVMTDGQVVTLWECVKDNGIEPADLTQHPQDRTPCDHRHVLYVSQNFTYATIIHTQTVHSVLIYTHVPNQHHQLLIPLTIYLEKRHLFWILLSKCHQDIIRLHLYKKGADAWQNLQRVFKMQILLKAIKTLITKNQHSQCYIPKSKLKDFSRSFKNHIYDFQGPSR